MSGCLRGVVDRMRLSRWINGVSNETNDKEHSLALALVNVATTVGMLVHSAFFILCMTMSRQTMITSLVRTRVSGSHPHR